MIYPPLHTFPHYFPQVVTKCMTSQRLNKNSDSYAKCYLMPSCFSTTFSFITLGSLPVVIPVSDSVARMNVVINRLTPSASPLKPPQNSFSLAAAVHSSPPLRLYAYPKAGVCASACVCVCVHEGVGDSNHLLQFPSVPTCSIETPPDPVIQTKW